MIAAAGILFVTRDGKALYLQRSAEGDFPGYWCFPGGKVEAGETAEEAAEREVIEEIGFLPEGSWQVWTRRRASDLVVRGPSDPVAGMEVDYTTFLQRVDEPFEPKLDREHTAYAWAPINQPPEPLHPGCCVSLARFDMDELGIARAIASGELTSPQHYENVWLFALRITGTGAAYRDRIDEYVWRDPTLYLNDEFLARCNGLPVIVDHPEKGLLTSEEYAERNVGTIMLPYIRGDEVWGVARIYDDATVTILQNEQFSTSPGINKPGGVKGKTEDGKNILIEGKPKLFDHICICANGVWDKGGPPTGVASAAAERTDSMAEETKAAEERTDAAHNDLMTKLDSVCEKLDSAHKRMDAMEEREKARDDARRDSRKDAATEEAPEDRQTERKEEKAEREEDRDDKRKDARKDESLKEWAEEEEEEPEHRKDRRRDSRKDARKDAETAEEKRALEKANEEREDARKDAARADAAEKANIEMQKKLDSLAAQIANITREVPAEEREALGVAQHRADSVAAMFGERVSAPNPGEGALSYRRRLLRPFMKHSPQFKDAQIDSADAATLGLIENQVYADAATASRIEAHEQPGILIPRISHDAAGRQITKFDGDMMAWLSPFMTDGARCKINRTPAAA